MTAEYQAYKLAFTELAHLSKDALHMHIGLAAMIGFALLSGLPLRSWRPWLAALAAALVGELLDLWDILPFAPLYYWTSSLHDILNTLFWPTVLLLLARAGVLGKR